MGSRPDSEAGFAKARSEQPKLVIAALNELGQTQAFLRRIRQDEATRQVGLVAIVAALRVPRNAAASDERVIA